MTQLSKALHRSARSVTTDPGLIPGCITTGRDRESHRASHNWSSVVQVRGWFDLGALLGSSRSSVSLWRSGLLQVDLGRQVNSVSSDKLVRLASWLSGQVLRSAVWHVSSA